MTSPPPSELTEEALLRSPCQTSDDREMETEYYTSDMSQVSRVKEKERLWKRTQRYILAYWHREKNRPFHAMTEYITRELELLVPY